MGTFDKIFVGYYEDTGERVFKISGSNNLTSVYQTGISPFTTANGTLDLDKIVNDITKAGTPYGFDSYINFYTRFKNTMQTYAQYVPNDIFSEDIAALETLLGDMMISFQDTTGWNDMIVSAANFKVPAANAPAEVAWKTILKAYSFDNGGSEYVQVSSIQLPHNIVPGSEVRWHTHFTPLTNIADGETIQFRLSYVYSSPNNGYSDISVMDCTFINDAARRARIAEVNPDYVSGTEIVAQASLITQYSGILDPGPDDTISFSGLITGRFERIPGTYAGSVIVPSADFHVYQAGAGTSGEFRD